MPYAFELFFDPVTDCEVRKAWRILAEISGSLYLEQNGVRPHVAMAVFEAEDEPAFNDWRSICSEMDLPLVLEEEGRGSFGSGVSFVRFHASTALVALHEKVMEYCCRSEFRVLEHYKSAVWVPHCTLAQDFSPDRIPAVERVAKELRFSCSWRAASFGIVRFPPTVLIAQTEEEANQSVEPTPGSVTSRAD